MKFKSVLSLALKNIFLKKSAYLKVLAGFFFAFLIIFVVLFYSGSLNIAYDDYLNVNADYLVYNVYGKLTAEQEAEIRSFPQVKSVYSYSTQSFVSDREINVTIGESSYPIESKQYYLAGKYIGRNSDYAYCENDFLSFSEESGEKFLICGETLKNENDILVSEVLLEFFGIEERESLIGKPFTANGYTWGEWVEDEHLQQPYSQSGVICGIVNGVYEHYDFLHFENEEVEASTTEISLNAFTGNEAFFARMDEMLGEETSHYFVGQYELENMKTVEGQQMLCNRFLSLICVVLLVVISVYVASNQYYLLQKNSVFYGILKANGADNKCVFLTHMSELAIILLIALITAFAFGVAAFFIMQVLFDDFVGIKLYFPAGAAVGSFFGFFALCVLLAVLITVFVYNKILKKSPVCLLKK